MPHRLSFMIAVSALRACCGQATITEISDVTDVDLRKGRDEEVLDMLMANPKVLLFVVAVVVMVAVVVVVVDVGHAHIDS